MPSHSSTSCFSSTSSPHFLNPTFSSRSTSSSQYDETSRVQNSFLTTSFVSLKQLPSSLLPGEVEDSRRKKISQGRSSKSDHHHVKKTSSFTPLTYHRDEYKKVIEDEKVEKQNKKLTSLSFSRKPFTYASSKIRLKNEDLFGDETYKFPVLGPGSGTNDLGAVVRTDFTDASKMLHGPFFVPAKVQQAQPRDELEHWGKEIYSKLCEDWSHLRFSLRCTSDDELLVLFDVTRKEESNNQENSYSYHNDEDSSGYFVGDDQLQSTNDYCNPALIATLGKYMNTMALHGVAADHRLRKRGDRWKVFEREKSAKNRSAATATNNHINNSAMVPFERLYLVFSFYTPWYSAAQRNVQKKNALEERQSARRATLRERAASATRSHRAPSAWPRGDGSEKTPSWGRDRLDTASTGFDTIQYRRASTTPTVSSACGLEDQRM